MIAGESLKQQSHPFSAIGTTSGDAHESKEIPNNELERDSNEEKPRKREVGQPRKPFENQNHGSRKLFQNLVLSLKKFQRDSENKTEAERKRELTEMKLNERLTKEREEISKIVSKEKEESIIQSQKRREETEKRLRRQIPIYRRNYRRNISKYLITKAEPPIMYKPKNPTVELKKMLESRKRDADNYKESDNSMDESDKSSTNQDIQNDPVNVEKSSGKCQYEKISQGNFVDMELDEEEIFLSQVPEIICDQQQGKKQHDNIKNGVGAGSSKIAESSENMNSESLDIDEPQARKF